MLLWNVYRWTRANTGKGHENDDDDNDDAYQWISFPLACYCIMLLSTRLLIGNVTGTEIMWRWVTIKDESGSRT
jgi:hypothetical protein